MRRSTRRKDLQSIAATAPCLRNEAMNGQIIDVEQSFHAGFKSGVISGEDGVSYKFDGSDWRDTTPPKVGLVVGFITDNGRARSVSRLDYRFNPVLSPSERVNGVVLYFDADSRRGMIIGSDGKRYDFDEQGWWDDERPESDMLVDFIADTYRAHSVRRVVIQVDDFETLAKLKGQSGSGCLLPASAVASALIVAVGLVVLLVT